MRFAIRDPAVRMAIKHAYDHARRSVTLPSVELLRLQAVRAQPPRRPPQRLVLAPPRGTDPMSCASCTSCELPPDERDEEQQWLLATCSAAVAQGGVMAETDELLQTFNDLGFAVANGRARSLEPLATLFNLLGSGAFTAVCAALLELEMTGDLVALAFVASDSDVDVFHRRLVGKGEAEVRLLVDEVNRAATLHEFVPGNSPIGRAVYRTDDSAGAGAAQTEDAAGEGEERQPVPPLELEETLVEADFRPNERGEDVSW